MSCERSPRASVPKGAALRPDLGLWELVERNAQGERHGECHVFRDDGSLYLRCRFENDLEQGPFVVYHPNGAVAREGTYAAGRLDGEVVAYAIESPMGEPLRSCCVPESAWQLRTTYRKGQFVRAVFYDREGRALLEDGSLRPERPPMVPADAELDESTRHWVIGDRTGGSSLAPERVCFFSEGGSLVEESEYCEAQKVFSRLYDAAGSVVKECHFIYTADRIRLLDGRYVRRFSEAAPSPYADTNIREERGSFCQGYREGTWSFYDEKGVLVRSVELGPVLDEAGILASPAFAAVADAAVADAAVADAAVADAAVADAAGENPVLPRGMAAAESFENLARRLLARGRTREALCAAARAAARRGDPALLRNLLSQTVVELEEGARAERARVLIGAASATLPLALEALVTGTPPAAALRTIAAVMPQADRTALDFADAALLYDPEQKMAHLTRALLRIQHGDDRGALADAAMLSSVASDAAESIRQYVRVSFPEPGFWPAREPVAVDPTLPAEIVPAQPIEEVRRVIRVYATRLARLREAIRAKLADRLAAGEVPPWLPPYLSFLLPDGCVELRRYPIRFDQEDESGARTTIETEVDEQASLDETTVAGLMRVARGDWAGLSWLCWATGLDRVALPERVAAPREFASAMARATTRCFRVHDRLTSGGLYALARRLPGFRWEGIEIDELPRHLLPLAATEYLEVRSMFLWLAGGDEVSPFQLDLRQA